LPPGSPRTSRCRSYACPSAATASPSDVRVADDTGRILVTWDGGEIDRDAALVTGLVMAVAAGEWGDPGPFRKRAAGYLSEGLSFVPSLTGCGPFSL
jgi:hypothetical protein